MSLDLVIAGNLLVDDIVYPDGRTRMGEAGGAALYMALAASLWDAKVGIASAGQESQKLVPVCGTREYAEGLQSAGPDLGRTRGIDARPESRFATRILQGRQ